MPPLRANSLISRLAGRRSVISSVAAAVTQPPAHRQSVTSRVLGAIAPKAPATPTAPRKLTPPLVRLLPPAPKASPLSVAPEPSMPELEPAAPVVVTGSSSGDGSSMPGNLGPCSSCSSSSSSSRSSSADGYAASGASSPAMAPLSVAGDAGAAAIVTDGTDGRDGAAGKDAAPVPSWFPWLVLGCLAIAVAIAYATRSRA